MYGEQFVVMEIDGSTNGLTRTFKSRIRILKIEFTRGGINNVYRGIDYMKYIEIVLFYNPTLILDCYKFLFIYAKVKFYVLKSLYLYKWTEICENVQRL